MSNKATLNRLLNDFYPYAKEYLGFDKDADVYFVSDVDNANKPLGKTAYYDPTKREISVYTDNRHPKDIMRSVSHELVHHAQNCRGDLGMSEHTGQGYAQNDEHLREMEREAYEKGNLCFRDWEDGIKSNLQPGTIYESNARRSKNSMNNFKTLNENFKSFLQQEGNESYEAGDKVKDLRNDTVGTVVEPMAGGAVIELEDGTIVKTRDKFLEKVEGEAMQEVENEGTLINVQWDTNGEGEPPPSEINLDPVAMREYEEIKATEGEEAASQAVSDMLSDETGWLVLNWEVAGSPAAEPMQEDAGGGVLQKARAIFPEGHVDIEEDGFGGYEVLLHPDSIDALESDPAVQAQVSDAFGKQNISWEMTDDGFLVDATTTEPMQEYGDHETQAAGGETESSRNQGGWSQDPELDQIADIARTVIEQGGGLHDLKKPLEAEAFDVTATSQFILVRTTSGDVGIASVNNVELTGDEELIDTPYGQLAVGRVNQGMQEGFRDSPEEKEMTSKMSNKEFSDYHTRDKHLSPDLKGDMGPIPGMEGPFQFRSGAVLYWDNKAGKYYDRGKDMHLDNEEAAQLTMENKNMKLKEEEVESGYRVNADGTTSPTYQKDYSQMTAGEELMDQINEIWSLIPKKAFWKVLTKAFRNPMKVVQLAKYYTTGGNWQSLVEYFKSNVSFLSPAEMQRYQDMPEEELVHTMLDLINENADEIIEHLVDHYNQATGGELELTEILNDEVLAEYKKRKIMEEAARLTMENKNMKLKETLNSPLFKARRENPELASAFEKDAPALRKKCHENYPDDPACEEWDRRWQELYGPYMGGGGNDDDWADRHQEVPDAGDGIREAKLREKVVASVMATLKEGNFAEYGKIDAEDGNPPSKIGQGDPAYMEAYNAVLVARGEEPLPVVQPDQAYLDALQSGSMKPSDHSYNKKGMQEMYDDDDYGEDPYMASLEAEFPWLADKKKGGKVTADDVRAMQAAERDAAADPEMIAKAQAALDDMAGTSEDDDDPVITMKEEEGFVPQSREDKKYGGQIHLIPGIRFSGEIAQDMFSLPPEILNWLYGELDSSDSVEDEYGRVYSGSDVQDVVKDMPDELFERNKINNGETKTMRLKTNIFEDENAFTETLRGRVMKRLQQLQEEEAESSEKHDDDPALKGDQDELPDELQKNIIDAEEEEGEKKEESLRDRVRRIVQETLNESDDEEEDEKEEVEEGKYKKEADDDDEKEEVNEAEEAEKDEDEEEEKVEEGKYKKEADDDDEKEEVEEGKYKKEADDDEDEEEMEEQIATNPQDFFRKLRNESRTVVKEDWTKNNKSKRSSMLNERLMKSWFNK